MMDDPLCNHRRAVRHLLWTPTPGQDVTLAYFPWAAGRTYSLFTAIADMGRTLLSSLRRTLDMSHQPPLTLNLNLSINVGAETIAVLRDALIGGVTPAWLASLDKRLAVIHARLVQSAEREQEMIMTQQELQQLLDQVTSEVNRQGTVNDGILALVTQMADLIKKQPGIPDTVRDQLIQQFDLLVQNNDKIADAVLAGTDQDPTTPE